MLMFTGTCDWVCASVDKGMRISIDLARFGVHGQVEQEDVVALSLQLGYIVDDVKDQGSVQGGPKEQTNKRKIAADNLFLKCRFIRLQILKI